MNDLTELKNELRNRGYERADLETTDQSVGYGFVITALYRDGKREPNVVVEVVNDELTETLDLDWDGAVGEDEHGYAQIDLTVTIER